MELQHSQLASANKLEVFVMCPGLSKEDITISFDKKEGVLEVMGKSNNEELNDVMELDISGKIQISPKYRSQESKATVLNGIAKISFGLAEDVNLIKVD